MRKLFVLLLLLFFFTRINAQNFQWAIPALNGSTAFDPDGNILRAGFFQGTYDFDPGLGVFNLSTSPNSNNLYVAKYDTSGNLLWATGFNLYSVNYSHSLLVDDQGCVYIAGTLYSGTYDFNPGPATYNLSFGHTSGFIVKLSKNGNFIWAGTIPGIGFVSSSIINSMQFDLFGNLILTGTFLGLVDFDPSPSATYQVNSTTGWAGSYDGFLLKLDTSRAFIGLKFFGGGGDCNPTNMTADINGNFFISGFFLDTVDFDAGPGITNLINTSTIDYKYFVCKYDSYLNFKWAKSFNISNAVFRNFCIPDSSGNVIISGDFKGTVDFDPGSGTTNLTALGTYPDIVMCKLDSGGDFKWARRLGNNEDNFVTSIWLEAKGKLSFQGYFEGTCDLNPGLPTNYFTVNSTNHGYFQLVLDSLGNYVQASVPGGLNEMLDMRFKGKNVYNQEYFLGAATDSADLDPGPGKYYLGANNGYFIMKVGACQYPYPAGTIAGEVHPCEGDSTVYSIAPVYGANSYVWTVPAGNTISNGQGTNSVNILIGTNPGSVTVSPVNTCNVGATNGISITPSGIPVITSQPTNQTVDLHDTVMFVVHCQNLGVTCQWQRKYLSNFVNIPPSIYFSGINSDTLLVFANHMSLNNYVFRCILAPGADCSDTTNQVTLTIINNTGIDESSKIQALSIFPNPVSNSGTISFTLKKAEIVKIHLTDVSGREMQIIANKQFKVGTNYLNWEASHLMAGIYFLKLEGENFTETKKVIVLN